MNVGFIGLGQMGRHMAANLYRGGVSLRVCDANPQAVEALSKEGVKKADSPAELAAWADVVFLSLPSVEIVERVIFGEGGIAGSAKDGLLLVDLGTTSYLATLEIGERLAKAGVNFADAPVSGMESRARDGQLTIMCGGEEALFERLRPLFERIGNCVLYLGALGSGQLGKLINQLLFDINAAALGEMLGLAAKLGLDPEKTVQILNSGTGRSWASEFFGPRILEGNFSEGYAMENAYKDIAAGSELSARLRIPLPVLSAASAIYQTALCMGLGGGDKGSMVKVYEEILGVQFRRQG